MDKTKLPSDVTYVQYIIDPEDINESDNCPWYSIENVKYRYYMPYVKPNEKYTVSVETNKGRLASVEITPKTGLGPLGIAENSSQPVFDPETNIITFTKPTYNELVPAGGSYWAGFYIGSNYGDPNYQELFNGTIIPEENGDLKINICDANQPIENLIGKECFINITYDVEINGFDYHVKPIRGRKLNFKPTKATDKPQSNFLKLTPCEKGIKVTVKYPQGYQIVSNWGSIHEEVTGINFYTHMNSNIYGNWEGDTKQSTGALLNSGEEFSFIFPFTTKDQRYKFSISGQFTDPDGKTYYPGDKATCTATKTTIQGKNFDTSNFYKSKVSIEYNSENESYFISSNYSKDSLLQDLSFAAFDDPRINSTIFYGKTNYTENPKALRYHEFTADDFYSGKRYLSDDVAGKSFAERTALRKQYGTYCCFISAKYKYDGITLESDKIWSEEIPYTKAELSAAEPENNDDPTEEPAENPNEKPTEDPKENPNEQPTQDNSNIPFVGKWKSAEREIGGGSGDGENHEQYSYTVYGYLTIQFTSDLNVTYTMEASRADYSDNYPEFLKHELSYYNSVESTTYTYTDTTITIESLVQNYTIVGNTLTLTGNGSNVVLTKVE